MSSASGAEALLQTQTVDISNYLIDEFKAGRWQETDTNVRLLNALGTNAGQTNTAAGLAAIAQRNKPPLVTRDTSNDVASATVLPYSQACHQCSRPTCNR